MSSAIQGISDQIGGVGSTMSLAKTLIPAQQEPHVVEAGQILKRYLSSPITFSMTAEIDKARNLLRQLQDLPAYIDGKLVTDAISSSEGIVFLTTARAGCFLTGQIGTGIVMANATHGWSAPSAIAYVGAGFGFQGGWDVADYVLFLNRSGVDTFVGGNQLVLSGDVGVSFGLGRHGTAELHVSGQGGAFTSGWALSKGLFAGASMQAGIIHTRHDLNQKFYNREVENTDILYGKIHRPAEGQELYSALADISYYK